MLAAFSAIAKTAGQLSLAWLMGGMVFLLLSRPAADPAIQRWRTRAISLLPWAAAILLLSLAAGLLARVSGITGQKLHIILLEPGILLSFALDTRPGQFSSLGVGAAIALLAAAILSALWRTAPGKNIISALVVALAAVTGALGPMSGHTAGSDNSAWLTPLHIAHVLCISIWLGGLPAWLGLVAAAGSAPDAARCAYTAQALQRFSRLAMICMLIIIFSGTLLSLEFISSQGDLLGTQYGLLITAKAVLLLGVLAIANTARTRLLPRMHDAAAANEFYPLAARWVAIEFALAAIILGLGSILSQTIPALHDQPYWWLPFRLSPEAAWLVWPAPLAVTGGAALGLLAGCALALWRRFLSIGQRILTGVAGFAGAALAVWGLSVAAYPGTYQRSEAPYLSLSIAAGMQHYQQHCVSCHGAGGLGDGPDAGALPKPPADLSAPHTALHTSGDIFWWLTHGMPEGGMPGFAGTLSRQDRWDIINFLRAFSQGFEARVLSPRIMPLRPWLGAPDFYYETADGQPAALRDFRNVSNVLLVFSDSSLPAYKARLDELRRASESLRGAGLELLVVRDAATQLSYELLSRTLSNRGSASNTGLPRLHMEFIIDRFGYIRARWIPEDESGGWQDFEQLQAASRSLSAEPQVLPPPGAHVH